MKDRKKVKVMIIWAALGAAVLMIWGGALAGLRSGTFLQPETLRYFQPEFLQRAAEYQRVSLYLYLARQAVTLFFLVLVTWWATGYFQHLDISFPRVAVYIFFFFLLLHVITLPLDFYRGYLVERSFALTAQTPLLWFFDYLKSLFISLIVSTFIFSGFYTLMNLSPQKWWLLAGGGFSILLLLNVYLYPLLIHPLFYDFTPLEDEVLAEEMMGMASRSGIEVEEILVADASQRTHKANAFFAGLGSSQRIVLFDNLLENFSREEVLVVIAHEMGHWKHLHIIKGILMASAGTLLSLYLLKSLLGLMKVGPGPGVIPLVILFFTLISIVSMPLQNGVSRVFERQADREALILTRNPEAFVTLKVNLAHSNLSVVQPHPLIKGVFYSHPPVMERIEYARYKFRDPEGF